jgi:carboxymethylenebutenolidase
LVHTAPIPPEHPKVAWWSSRKFSASNRHIRAMCDRFASIGYAAVAPAVFDRFVRNFESGYTPDEIATRAAISEISTGIT